MNRLIIIAALIVFPATVASAQQVSPSPSSTHESSPEIRQKTFQKVWSVTNEQFFDPTFGGLDWEKVKETFAPRVAGVKTDAELYELLREMLGQLHVSHFEIVPPELLSKLREQPVIVGMSLKLIDGQVVIWRVWPNSSVADSPLRPGYSIKAIDGVDVKDVEGAHKLMAGAADTTLRVAYLNEADKINEVTLRRRYMRKDEAEKQELGDGAAFYSIFVAKRLSDGIGYIHFSTFIGELKKKMTAAIESMHDAPGIIIDLRGNGGGDDSLGLVMADMLFEKKVQLMITRTRKGDDFYYKANPRKKSFRGPVAILLDAESASASEQFAAGLQEVGRVVVIGNKTPGDDMDADVTELPTGALMVYPYGQPRTPKGVIIDGHGVIPDIDVSLSRKGLLAGDDAQLSAAIEWIKKTENQKHPVAR